MPTTIDSEGIIFNDASTITSANYLVPVGAVMSFPMATAPTGWLKLNGATLSRSTYSNLWAFAQASGNLVTDTAWYSTSATGSFSQGNGSTTFRLPDFRGEFVRAWDDSRGIDSGRGMGVWQIDNFKSHNHSIVNGMAPIAMALSVPLNPLNPNAKTFQYNETGYENIQFTGGIETRPRNIPLLYCIKF